VHGTPPASFDEDPDLHGTMSKIPAKPKEGDGGGTFLLVLGSCVWMEASLCLLRSGGIRMNL
jgi:hypothetical protein